MAQRQSVVVLAPHPDDEALGAAGFIKQAVLQGYDVHVILMTSGDGFVQDAERYYLSLSVNQDEYMHLGYERQIEVRRAMANVGVAADYVTFLGFPDGGLDYLLLHLDEPQPFASPTTGCNAVPYIESGTYKVAYCGSELLNILRDTLNRIQPHWVITPLLLDQHPDHWATAAFGTLAVMACQTENRAWASQSTQLGYLVHWTGWPLPLGYRPEMRQEVPAALQTYPAIQWHEFRYESEIVEAKRAALLSYDSQVELIKPFLLAFVRKTEIFGRQIPMPLDKDGEWPQPQTDMLAKILGKDFGIFASHWWSDSFRDYVSIEARLEAPWEVRVAVYSAAQTMQFYAWTVTDQDFSDAQLTVKLDSNAIEISWPSALYGNAAQVLKGVVLYQRGKMIGRTGFWLWSAGPAKGVDK
jgi:LmbE family N-acetylglucosaminyl deacetylase